ncbi:HepT-like ribonuclease domain-containing protein, partial [Candidatus Aquicultor secundus]
AAQRVSGEARVKLPELPWGSMAGMRNFLIHEYDDVDLAIVWNTVSVDLPPLIVSLEKFFR